MDRSEFRCRCAEVGARSPAAEIVAVLGIAGVFHGASRRRSAASLYARGFTPGYVAAWLLDRIHQPAAHIAQALACPSDIERRPSWFVAVGPTDPDMVARVCRMVGRLSRARRLVMCEDSEAA